MKRKIFIVIITGWLSSSLVFFACSKKSSDTIPSGNNSNPTGNAVSMSNFAFVASTTTVKAGTTVTWTNNDSAPHTVTADDNSFSSATLNRGDTYSHTFSSVGTFPYHCNFHSMMTATIVVQ